MGLFLKIVRKDPLIFRTYYFEAYFAIRTEDKIPRFLGSFKRDISVTDGTFHFLGHGRPPSSYIEVLILEMQEKIKSPIPSGLYCNRDRRQKWAEPSWGGIPLCNRSGVSLVMMRLRPRKEGVEGFEFFLLHPYPYLYQNDGVEGGSKKCLVWVCLKFSSS